MIIKRSKIRFLFGPNTGEEVSSNAEVDDIYGTPEVSDDDIPASIRREMGDTSAGDEIDFSESEGELDDQQAPGSDVTNREIEDTSGTAAAASTPEDSAKSVQPTDGEDRTAKLLESLVERLAPRTHESKELTAEQKAEFERQIKEFTQPVSVTREILEEMGFEDPSPKQIAAYQKLHQATVTNAVRLAQIAFEQSMDPIRQQVQVLGHHVSTQQEKVAVETFYSQFEDLKPHSKLVDMVSKQVASDQEWLQGKSFQDVAKRVANDTKALLAELGVGKTGQTSQSGANRGAVPPKSAAPSMQTLGGSGRSSGKGSGGGNNSDPSDADIYT